MGRFWVCPFCTMANPVEEAYFCNLDARNNRLDRAEKPELSHGSVEYDVGAYPEYALRDEKDNSIPVRPLHYLFLLDVSQRAAATFLSDYVEALLKSLHELAQQYPQCRVAFITYGSTLHFYNVRHPRIPQLIVADVDNPFVPLPFTSLCWLTLGTDLDLVDAFLMRVPEYAEDLHETQSAMGAAVQVAMLVLAGQHGGHVVVSAHRAPQCGVGAIKLREQHTLYGTDKEKDLLRPIDGFWKTTATACAKQQISFDLHMFADEYCELVTLSQPCHVSNGRVHLFANYDRETDATRVQAALDQTLLEEAGYAGILRLRCSTGLRVQSYHGHFLSQDPHDMDLAHVQGSSTFFVEFAHEGKLEKTSHAYFQVALLYTTRGGQRRVRVHSVRMPVVTTLTGVFESDLEATLMAYIHEAIGIAVNKGLQQARTAAQERVLKMLIAYRRVCSSKATTSLLMPSRLRLIPLYVLSLLKADALVEGTTVRIDDRVQKLFHLMTIPMHQCLTYLYPTLYAVHHLPTDPTSGIIDVATGRCIMPGWRQLIFDSITSDGVYVLCDEQARLVYMWVGSCVTPELAIELFGTSNAAEVGRSVFFDDFGEKLRNVLCACLLREDGMRRLVILHERDRTEDAFFRQLKEENEGGSMGYDEFLVRLHREVNKSLS
ncbi:protein transport protein Sec24C [Trypanosoma grayi]|uniref:protein transport protein Sec24C n=1 Tax=Trypanosoma grayi TaxID=71804 RepID=UPI0004F41DE2|nr:protein transport protein Sec24C [Trypanosoma grayi]KEG06012.1 protein transport protein Sec24C [Trypanosoma grayi]